MGKRPRNARSEIATLARNTRLSITIIGTILAGLFTWLQIKDVPIASVVQSAKPEFIQRGALILYYLSWIAGSRFDVGIQEKVYADDPQRGQFAWITVAIILIFAIVALVLFWASGDEQKFSIALTIFGLANLAGWQHIVRRIKPIINASRKRYRNDHDFIGLELLHIVSMYMTGKWQWHRFGVMGLILVVSDAICLIPPVRSLFSQLAARVVPQMPDGTIEALLPDTMLLIFVIIAESWIWTMRVRVATSLGVVETLGKRYELRPRRNRDSHRGMGDGGPSNPDDSKPQ